MEVLQRANDARLTTEIARFNLEANLTPLELSGTCFSQMKQELEELIALALRVPRLRKQTCSVRHPANTKEIRFDTRQSHPRRTLSRVRSRRN